MWWFMQRSPWNHHRERPSSRDVSSSAITQSGTRWTAMPRTLDAAPEQPSSSQLEGLVRQLRRVFG